MTPSGPSGLPSASSRRSAKLNARNAATGAPQLAVRIGLEGGPVVVDDAGDVFGEAPNIAARVQAAAEPGTVLVTSTVQRQVAGLFIVEDKGAYELKGAPAPMNLYRILRISGGRRRRQAELLTPFVGREKDLERAGSLRRNALLRATGSSSWSSASRASASPDWLKSFAASWPTNGTLGSNGASSQLLQNTPLHPVLGWGRVRFGGPEVSARAAAGRTRIASRRRQARRREARAAACADGRHSGPT